MTENAELTDPERALALKPCECGHDLNNHGTICWTCEDAEDADAPQCGVSCEALMVERIGWIVAARLEAVRALLESRVLADLLAAARAKGREQVAEGFGCHCEPGSCFGADENGDDGTCRACLALDPEMGCPVADGEADRG